MASWSTSSRSLSTTTLLCVGLSLCLGASECTAGSAAPVRGSEARETFSSPAGDHDHDHDHAPASSPAPVNPSAATGSLRSGPDWYEAAPDSTAPGAQNDVVYRGDLYKVDNSPAAIAYRAWVEATVLPGAPDWASQSWNLAYLIPFEMGDGYAGFMTTPKWHSNHPGLLQINLDAADWSPNGALHHVTIHELAHHCDRNKLCDLPFNEGAAVDSLAGSSAIAAAEANWGGELPKGELLAELAAFSVTGRTNATPYTDAGHWGSAMADEYWAVHGVAEAARAAQEAAYDRYLAGFTEYDEYTVLHDEYLALHTQAADLRQALDNAVSHHDTDLCADFTEALSLAGAVNIPACL